MKYEEHEGDLMYAMWRILAGEITVDGTTEIVIKWRDACNVSSVSFGVSFSPHRRSNVS